MKIIDKIAVSEYFYSIQGEGLTMGVPAFFLRLKGCNLVCGGWGAEKDGIKRKEASWICDTMSVWMKGNQIDFNDLWERFESEFSITELFQAGVHLIITGGEPLIQQDKISSFLEFIEDKLQFLPVIEIETNGTIVPRTDLLIKIKHWNCSPKLSNSGMPVEKRIHPEALQKISQTQSPMFKFVISEMIDFEEIQTDFLYTSLIKKEQIVLMPACSDLNELLDKNKIIAELCKREKLRMSSRLHIEIWNQLTGV